MARARRTPSVEVLPLTPERWPDLVKLFGPRGACAGCWCMWWRLPRAAWERGRGVGNERGMEAYLKGGKVPGLLAYDRGEPVGWIAVEPREAYPRLERSRILARVDGAAVWSITCFFVARSRRGEGLAAALLRAALRHAKASGASVVEAYPVEPGRDVPDTRMYTGAASTFRALGFREVARRTPLRPIVRKALRGRRPRRVTGRRARRGRARERARSTRRSYRPRASSSPRDP